MSRIPELLRELADEWEKKENDDDINFITVNTRINETTAITYRNKEKMREVANAFATFANILERD